MEFVQIIEFTTDRIDEILALQAEWATATEGKRTATANVLGRDRDRENTYTVVVEFPDRAAAERNDALPETQAFAEKMMKLCTGEPKFTNLDVLDRRGL